MRSVTKEEAQSCKDRMAIWANSERKTYRASNGVKYRSSFEKRIYKPLNKFDAAFGREPGLDITKTLWCATYMFAPHYFPLCPEVFEHDRLGEYYQNIKSGEVFAVTDKIEEHPEFYFSLTTLKSVIQKDKQAIIVLCEKSDNKFMIVGIELYDKNKWFIHYNLGSYLSIEEAELAFIEKQALPVKEYYNLGYKNAYK